MSQPSVSLHPYFKVHSGKLEAARAVLPKFVARTSTETNCLIYHFTLNGDIVFCREAYTNAEGLLHHLENVAEPLNEMLAVSDLIRLEVHGSEEELAKLRGPLAALKPDWFIYETGLPQTA